MNERLVSIVIPFFNRIPWVLEAIQSVQNQTYTNWELILINDGSTDDTREISTHIKKDSRIFLFNQKNMGVAIARNKGISMANGYYIAFLDSDDLWAPEKLTKQVSYMEDNGYLASHTCYTLFNNNGTVEIVNTGSMEGDLLKRLIITCPLNTSSAVVAKKLVDSLNPPFPLYYEYGEDACFWISLAAQTNIGVIREPLTFTRKTATRAADDPRKVRTALVNILGFILRDAYLSTFNNEINIIAKNIALVTETIEMQEEPNNKNKETKTTINKWYTTAFCKVTNIIFPINSKRRSFMKKMLVFIRLAL